MIKFGLFNSQSACSIFCGASSKRQKSLFSLFGLYKNQSPCSIFCLTRPQTEILLQSVSWSLQRSSCCLLKNEDSVFKFKALALVVGFNLLMTIFRALALGTWCTTFVLTLGTAHFGTGYHWKSLDGSGLSTFLFWLWLLDWRRHRQLFNVRLAIRPPTFFLLSMVAKTARTVETSVHC